MLDSGIHGIQFPSMANNLDNSDNGFLDLDIREDEPRDSNEF